MLYLVSAVQASLLAVFNLFLLHYEKWNLILSSSSRCSGYCYERKVPLFSNAEIEHLY